MRRRLTASGLALSAVLLLAPLAACSGGGGEEDPEAGSSPAASSPEEEAAGGSQDDGIPEETVPEDELTPPGGGEFTEEQREYLADRVPEGTDPGAILELGNEACDRVGYLQRHDPDGVAEAVADGEVPGAAEAIPHLCPEFADLLGEGEQ
ncbi:hypothetical protein RM780_04510 [Streptomyces sp. DSM 44917]|uniref:DUF732 domain-containing protein n=1 Tax=Streptomyces boetiae TaxID=3075541 RepID=A0ABU2L3T9_9ACTN|nr:hypothetical protein [Streptomyces sp. DSM 44917]MDT0306224.1 hypothetical protein [Streptomyces sp. DSM 44917]